MKSRRFNKGIGMIEVLVTLFILSIGLLGVASLQLVGSFTNAEALSRTQAEFVAQQATERLRAASVIDINAEGSVIDPAYFNAANYNFDGLDCGGANVFACACNARPAIVPDCEGGNCTQANMAVYDAWVLSCSAVQANPQTQLFITCADNASVIDALPCSPGSFIQVQLRWPLRARNGTGEATGNSTEVFDDTRCAQGDDQAFSCVTKVIVL